eukprot:TRINITY_DN3353_c0_g1_i5.p1 TRINITY_DN3353_c0_g1~~TRINITY_DN3353_c0_g1_i5.p1  ORF type:complete len:452 (-),score=168.26 TRINITY_DN3353_c0_g1_i5:54-1409(-)
MFKRLLSSKQCVFINEGFFEWKEESKGNLQPYFVKLKKEEPSLTSHLNAESPSHIKEEAPPHIKEEGPSHIKEEAPPHIKEEGLSHVKGEWPSHIKGEVPSHIDHIEANSEVNVKEESEEAGIHLKPEQQGVTLKEEPFTPPKDIKSDPEGEGEGEGDGAGDSGGDIGGDSDTAQLPPLLYMAGLYDTIHDPETGEVTYSFCVVTTPAHGELNWLHDRMPAILKDKKEILQWLGYKLNSGSLFDILKPKGGLDAYPVSKGVGNSNYDSPENIVPISIKKETNNITKYFTKVKDEPTLKEEIDREGYKEDIVKKEGFIVKKEKEEVVGKIERDVPVVKKEREEVLVKKERDVPVVKKERGESVRKGEIEESGGKKGDLLKESKVKLSSPSKGSIANYFVKQPQTDLFTSLNASSPTKKVQRKPEDFFKSRKRKSPEEQPNPSHSTSKKHKSS